MTSVSMGYYENICIQVICKSTSCRLILIRNSLCRHQNLRASSRPDSGVIEMSDRVPDLHQSERDTAARGLQTQLVPLSVSL